MPISCLAPHSGSVRSRLSVIVLSTNRIPVPFIPMVMLLTLFSALVNMAAAQTSRLERIHIVDRGVYRAETIARAERRGQESIINTVRAPRLVNDTKAIVGQVGVRFGLRYIAVGTDGGAQLKLVIKYPPSGLRDPATGRFSFESELNVRPTPGAINYWEYHFEHDWEVILGQWVFEFWIDDKKLTEERFCVYELNNPHAAGAAVTGKCPGLVQGGR
jgi:hypothetical protein